MVAMTWGNETKVLRAGLDGVMPLGGVTLTYAQVTGAIVSVVMLEGVFAVVDSGGVAICDDS
jgi:hypothetical protein